MSGFKRGDLIAIAGVLLFAGILLAAFFLGSAGVERITVRVYQNGALVRELPLDRDMQFTVSGEYENTVTISAGRVAVTHADCPGEDCVHTGWISRAGSSIVCLPNRVEIRLVGVSGPEVDAMAGQA